MLIFDNYFIPYDKFNRIGSTNENTSYVFFIIRCHTYMKPHLLSRDNLQGYKNHCLAVAMPYVASIHYLATLSTDITLTLTILGAMLKSIAIENNLYVAILI